MKPLFRLMAPVMVMGLASSASMATPADYLFNTMDLTIQSGDPLGGATLGGSFSTQGNGFNVSHVGMWFLGEGEVTVSLYSDNNATPGSLLFPIASQPVSGNQAVYFPLTTPYLLEPQTRYWIMATANVGESLGWAYSQQTEPGIGVAGEYYYWENQSHLIQTPEDGPFLFAVAGDVVAAVPDSGSGILEGTLAMLVLFGAYRMTGKKHSNASVAA